MNVTRLMWTRLMCSRNRQETETLQTKLSKAGIVSEIRYNPVEAKRGAIGFEIVVDERDLFKASKVCQGAGHERVPSRGLSRNRSIPEAEKEHSR